MRYYHREHQEAYRRIEQQGLTQWNDLFDADRINSLEDFPNRHLRPEVLRAELESHGLAVVRQDGGDVVAQPTKLAAGSR
jgi:hypothetical protein